MAALLNGCVSGPIHDSFRPTIAVVVTQPFKGKAALINSQDMRSDVQRYREQGFILIGTSDYIGKYPEMDELSAQAKRVGASVVVFSGQYKDRVSGVQSFVLQNPPQTIQSQTSGTLYGNGGSASYYGSTTTTVPGGYTQYQVPYAFDRFEIHAAFFAPTARSRLMQNPQATPSGIGGIGAVIEPRPTGLLVLNVASGGPAAKAGVRIGDTIVALDGVSTEAIKLEEALQRLRGQVGSKVVVTLHRTGGTTKTVQVIRKETSKLRFPQN